MSELAQEAKPKQREPHANPKKKSRAADDNADRANGRREYRLYGSRQMGDVFGHGLWPAKRRGVPLLAICLR
ncbi:MAG: hypothetical protein ACLQJ0_05825 [Steroidobacteraceae bacterium]|jgi:hypothetical protein